MYADLTVVGGDPLADITAAADVRAVMLGGVLCTVDQLLHPFEDSANRPAVLPRNRMLDPVPDNPTNARYWWHDPHYVAAARTSCCLG